MRNSLNYYIDIMLDRIVVLLWVLGEIDDIHGSCCLIVDWVFMIWTDKVLLWWNEENCVVVEELKMWGSCCCCCLVLKSEYNMLKCDRNQLKLIEPFKLMIED